MFADSTNTNIAYAYNKVKTIINFYALEMVWFNKLMKHQKDI